MLGRLLVLAWFSLSLVVPIVAGKAAYGQSVVEILVINEIQTRGIDDEGKQNDKYEFIEIYNPTNNAIGLIGWSVQYFGADTPGVFDGNSTPTRDLVINQDIDIAAFSTVLLSYKGYLEADLEFETGSSTGWLAGGGGHVRIIDGAKNVIDVAGWGTAKSAETLPAEVAPVGKSIERYLDCSEGISIDTDNNKYDFYINQTPTPRLISGTSHPDCEPEPPIEEPSGKCEAVMLSEILPNPAGADAGKEFIELHNPTDEGVQLVGCALQTTANTKQFVFGEEHVLAAGEYRAFYDSETGLSLQNNIDGEVLLISGDSEIATSYQKDMKDNHAWALINNQWQITTIPTPNAPNQPTPNNTTTGGSGGGLEPCPAGKFRNPETNRCKNIETTSALTPCRPGQERNPETNRCRSIVLAGTSLVPCRPGQERNPETNRCRSILATSTSLTPCKPGQERNPETNRCRTIQTNTQAECKEGQERNPETNRCRKVATLANVSPSVGSNPENSSKNMNYVALVAISLGIVGYGLYEYRADASAAMLRLRDNIAKTGKK